jgi:hypothetical protein
MIHRPFVPLSAGLRSDTKDAETILSFFFADDLRFRDVEDANKEKDPALREEISHIRNSHA